MKTFFRTLYERSFLCYNDIKTIRQVLDMGIYPEYHDSLTHQQYGKSRLPLFIVQNILKHHYPLHHHNFAELSLVIEGTGTEIVNGNPHLFRKGTVTFLLPHHIHEVRLNSSFAFKYNCMFDLNLLFLSPSDRELSAALLKTGLEYPSHYDLNEEQCAHMAGLLELMRQEYINDSFGKDSLLRSKLLEAFVFLLRTSSFPERYKSSSIPSKSGVSLTENILHYLHIHYQEEISLTGLAKQFQVNSSYLSRIFKQSAGKTLTEYLHSLRVSRAASLLATTAMSITDIALEVGFDHTRTLTRTFKEAHGTTPKQYRSMFSRNSSPNSPHEPH